MLLKSVEHNYYYKVIVKIPMNAFKEHNAGMTASIQPFIPFAMIYKESFNTREEAIIREKYFKTSAGRQILKKQNLMFLASCTMPAQ